jgi:biopolymer transport protein ExbB
LQNNKEADLKKFLMIWVAFFCMGVVCAMAQDMRTGHLSQEKKRQMMQKKADDELRQAKAAAKEKVLEIKNDKKTLKAAIADLKNRNRNLKQGNHDLEKSIHKLKETQARLKVDLSESRVVNQELAGFIRINAKDLQSLLAQSLQSALIKDRYQFLDPISGSGENPEKFPSMDDITRIADTLFEEIKASGEVKITMTDIIDRQGREQKARVLTLGNFTGIYALKKASGSKDEVGFLLYSDQSRRFFALSRLPSPGMTAKMAAYFKGESPDVPMDISKGGALRQLTHQLNLVEQVPKGGPIIWPILAIFGLALLILVERIIFFIFKQIRVESFMVNLRELVAGKKWEECEHFLLSKKGRLIPRVLLTALPFRNQSRQDMENALQEAILGEIPRIERFLSTLGMLAAIAPLLGLLGTVTGMINTFHVITYFGAGDPRMMSGGISEALVTTMLGLTVAIPIMLFHTLLSRRVETQIGMMEEKAVAFVNMVFKTRNGGGQ